MSITRRQMLGLGGLAAAAGFLPSIAAAQTPRRGGTLTIRQWDPPHWDHMLIVSYKTNVALSFTHSRLVKHRAGPTVAPGTFPLEGDLAESWTQPNDTTYVFTLRRGVRWHAKPPVNGRELTADDVKYSLERFMTIKGNSNRYMLQSVERVEAPERYTVRVTLKEPFAWFLDMLATPMAIAIVARECVDKFGDLRKAEAVIGTGPWMLDSYRPNQGYTLVRNPNYFLPGLPYIDRIEAVVDEDNASRIAAFLAGKYDIGTENPGVIARADWAEIRDVLKQRRPNLRIMEFPSNQLNHLAMRTDQKPFNDRRVRQAISLAVDRQEISDATYGVAVLQPPVPTGLREWSLPVAQLGDGARYYEHDLARARRLLAAAGYPNGFPASLCFTTYGSNVLVDQMQLVLKSLKEVGIEVKLDQKEYGAYIASCFNGNFPSMTYGPQTPFVDPDNYLFAQYYPGEPRNQSHVNDSQLTEMLVRQRRTMDPARRREIIHEIQRYLATQQYYVAAPSQVYVAVWDGALKNYGPNLGYDWGGRLAAAWLER